MADILVVFQQCILYDNLFKLDSFHLLLMLKNWRFISSVMLVLVLVTIAIFIFTALGC